MNTEKFKMLKSGFLVVLMLCFISNPIEAQNKRKDKKKKQQTEMPAAPKKQQKPKTIASLVKKSKKMDGIFTMYQDTISGTLQMLITKDQLDKDFIYFSQIADGGMDGGRLNRGSYKPAYVFRIIKHFNKIEFIKQNTSFYFDPNNALSKSKEANISHGVVASIKIEASDHKKGQYLIKPGELFLKESFQQLKPARSPKMSPISFSLGNLDKNKTKVTAVKNYPDNVNVTVEYVYSKPSILRGGSNALADSRNVSIKLYHSLIAMPENDYEVRYDDPRVGFFTSEVDDQTSTEAIPYRDIIHRWNLKKKNPELAVSEPVTPITWWMENSTPIEWRETIKNAVLEWNKAFEKAGFKNAIEVKQQPDDATWDAGDIRYNVLRWTSSPTPPFGGYGPRLANPRTGEIIASDIMLEFVHFTSRVFYDKLFDKGASSLSETEQDEHLYCSMGHEVHKNMLFGKILLATSSDNPDMEMERMKKEAMKALIMHEIGHTLGLNHNMKASHLFSPEELANAELIEGKCLTGSVMDYAAINLTKDRTKQGQYFDTALGPYDVWAIQFGYTPFESVNERNELLEKSTNPELIFGNDADDMRAPGKAIDPRVMVSDLSNDPIAYSKDRFEMIDNLMPKLKDKYTNDGESYQEMRQAYNVLTSLKGSAANVTSRFIGGIYVDRAMAGQKGATQPYTPVSLEDQKRAMNVLKTYVFAPSAFQVEDNLYNYLANQRRGFNFMGGPEDPKIHNRILGIQKRVLSHLLHYNTLQRISDSELYGNAYKLSSVMTDLNNAIFKADIYGNVNSFRQNLQLEYTRMLLNMITGKLSALYPHTAKSMALYNLKTIRNMAAPSGNISSRAHKQHLRTLIDNGLKELK